MKEKETPPEQCADIKLRIQETQNRAAIAVNTNLLYPYWEIGTYVSRVQKELGWGSNVVKTLSGDIWTAFPEMQGFSVRNLKYMIRFADKYQPGYLSELVKVASSKTIDNQYVPKVKPVTALLASENIKKVQTASALIYYCQ